jgi:hydroxymethylbilane synthase
VKIVLGTRGSRLALAQTEIAKTALLGSSAVESVDVRVIKTTGDERLDLRLNDSGKTFEKGLFTKELEEALLNGQIDLAVHSLKDLPTESVDKLVIEAVLPREDPVDVLVSKIPGGLKALPVASLVATGSPRRAQQIIDQRPDIHVCNVRGNVPTRLEKLIRNTEWAAIVLARAGLRRLGLDPEQEPLLFQNSTLFVTELAEMLPAAGQGAIAFQCRENDDPVRSILSRINDRVSWDCVRAEREFLRLVGGGCSVPIGVYAKMSGDTMTLAAIAFDDGGKAHRGTVTLRFSSPVEAAKVLFRKIYDEDR